MHTQSACGRWLRGRYTRRIRSLIAVVDDETATLGYGVQVELPVNYGIPRIFPVYSEHGMIQAVLQPREIIRGIDEISKCSGKRCAICERMRGAS